MSGLEQKLEALVEEIRSLKELVGTATLPTVLSYERAARELDISVPTLKRMLARGQIFASDRGEGFDPGISRAEILRIAANRRTDRVPKRQPRAKAPAGGSVSEQVRAARRAAKAKAKLS